MFLATTANSRFWDPEGKIVFLGEWCARHNNRDTWKDRNYEIMPSPWHDRERYRQAASYVDKVYENILVQLGNYLTEIHDLQSHPNYWRIIVGRWLMTYVHTFYDRYTHVKESLERYGHLKTYGLPETMQFTASEFIDSVGLLMNDTYNLLIFSEIFRYLHYPFEARVPLPEETQSLIPAWAAQKKKYFTRSAKGLARYLRYRLFLAWYRLAAGSYQKTVLYRPAISWFETLKLFIKSGFRLIPLELPPTGDAIEETPALSNRHREGLSNLQPADEFEGLLIACLKRHLPTLYLEGFSKARQTALQTVGALPRRIFSVQGWSSGELFKIVAAETAARGGTLMTAQHGGAYGTLALVPYEDHERKITDTFYAWGWADADQPRTKNLPSPLLSRFARQKPLSTRKEESLFLFVTSNFSPYLLRFDTACVARSFRDYDTWRQRFLEALQPAIRSQLILRPYSDDFGRGVLQRLREQFRDVRFQNGTPLLKHLREVSAVVIDHATTSLLEVLNFNVPTLLYWNPKYWELQPEASRPYFSELERVGIWSSSPEEAAGRLNEGPDSLSSWWNRPEVQKARNLFITRFGWTNRRWIDQWAQELSTH